MATELYAVTELNLSTAEHSLTTDTSGPDADTTSGAIQLWLDLADMGLADVLQIRLYEKVQSGGTQRLAKEWIVNGLQAAAEPVWSCPAQILMHGWDFTVKATTGTFDVYGSIRKA